jgi:hypothetical protein
MELSCPSEVNTYSSTQEIMHLWTSEVHYYAHKSLPLVPNLS